MEVFEGSDDRSAVQKESLENEQETEICLSDVLLARASATYCALRSFGSMQDCSDNSSSTQEFDIINKCNALLVSLHAWLALALVRPRMRERELRSF